MAVRITFNKTSKGEGSRIIGKLRWGNDEYEVVTGGYGKGAIPDGIYDIKVRYAATGNISTMKSGFVNPITKRGWFLPLSPQFDTVRHGFGIHPDGNKPGTKGCVGLQGNDIKKFWDKWLATSLNTRPSSLLVSNKI